MHIGIAGRRVCDGIHDGTRRTKMKIKIARRGR